MTLDELIKTKINETDLAAITLTSMIIVSDEPEANQKRDMRVPKGK